MIRFTAKKPSKKHVCHLYFNICSCLGLAVLHDCTKSSRGNKGRQRVSRLKVDPDDPPVSFLSPGLPVRWANCKLKYKKYTKSHDSAEIGSLKGLFVESHEKKRGESETVTIEIHPTLGHHRDAAN